MRRQRRMDRDRNELGSPLHMISLLVFLLTLLVGSPAWATITNVQSTTSATTSIALSGVTAGNTLVLIVSWYRDVGTGAAFPTPTDSNGTVAVATAPTPATASAPHDLGVAIFYVTNAASGTHTFTLASLSESHATLVEFNPMALSSFDVATNAKTDASSSGTSQVTGTTASTAQASELVVIACTYGNQSGGVSDIGWTDPVSGFTTLQKVSDSATQLPTFHAWKEVSSIGTQAATFNWTTGSSSGYMQAAIATFKTPTTTQARRLPILFP
jgi:hypothetical protein